MKPLPHRYDVRLTGGPSGYAQLSASGLPQLQTAPPAEYDGPGDAWSPEHLLLAAVQACFLFTLRAIARVAKLEFTALELDAIYRRPLAAARKAGVPCPEMERLLAELERMAESEGSLSLQP